MIKYNNSNINDWNFGDDNITKVYYDGDVVYQKITNGSTPPSPSGLPSGYTEIEYVENKNYAYIDTGFKPNQDTRIIAEMQCVSSTNSALHFGEGGWDRLNGMWLTYETGIRGTLHLSWGTKTTWSIYSSVHGDTNKHTYDWNKNEFYMDNSLVGSVTYEDFQATDNLGIFTVISDGQGDTYARLLGRLYSFKMYDNGTLVRDLIPCTRDSDSKVGVYDIVNDVFYYSAKSGYELVAPSVTPSSPKWIATYTDSTTSSAECDSNTSITSGEIDKANLLELNIGDCITDIQGYSLFYSSSLTSLTIGSGVESIGDLAFLQCSRLSSITIYATTPPTLGSSVFDNTNDCPIYVPSGYVTAYQNAWSSYASRIQAIPM